MTMAAIDKSVALNIEDDANMVNFDKVCAWRRSMGRAVAASADNDAAAPAGAAGRPARAVHCSWLQLALINSIHRIGSPQSCELLATTHMGSLIVMLMFNTTTWVEAATLNAMMTYACFYGGFGQMVAGVFEMIKGNTFAATAFISYGAFWMAWFVHQFTVKTSTAAAAAGATAAFTSAKTFVVGETLIMCLWGVFSFLFWIPTLRKNGCLCFVFGSLFLTFFLLAGGQWSAACSKAAGYFGFVCGCSAIYTAFAEIYQENLGIMLPGLRPIRLI